MLILTNINKVYYFNKCHPFRCCTLLTSNMNKTKLKFLIKCDAFLVNFINIYILLYTKNNIRYTSIDMRFILNITKYGKFISLTV